MFQAAVRDFAESEVRPRVHAMEQAAQLDPTLIPKFFELGLMGIEIPEAHGGAGGSLFMTVLAVEELSAVDASAAIFVDVQNTLVNALLLKWASDDIKKRYLPRLAAEVVGAYALSEAGSGSDAFGLQTKAMKQGDRWILDGRKLWITNGAEAGLFVIFTNTNFAKGYKVAIETLNTGRIGIGAQMIGVARGALDASLKYVKERQQFNKPVAEFQGVQFQLAQAATELEAARLMVYNAARLEDAGESYTKEAAMAKLLSSQVAERVTSLAVELFGGYGYTKEYPVEKFYRDAKIGTIYEGTSNMQLNTIAKLLLK